MDDVANDGCGDSAGSTCQRGTQAEDGDGASGEKRDLPLPF